MEIGNKYTRDEIAAELGGSAREYLPRVNGKVVCACLRMDLNPDAPEIILAGFGPQIEESAAVLCKQRGEIPVFIKQEINEWEYVGDYEVEKSSTNAEEIKKQEIRSGRFGQEGISRIIYLKEISKSKSLRLRASAVNN
jgi:hypothetical protein